MSEDMKVQANVLRFGKTSAFAETRVTFLNSGELAVARRERRIVWRKRRCSISSFLSTPGLNKQTAINRLVRHPEGLLIGMVAL